MAWTRFGVGLGGVAEEAHARGAFKPFSIRIAPVEGQLVDSAFLNRRFEAVLAPRREGLHDVVHVGVSSRSQFFCDLVEGGANAAFEFVH